MALAGALAVFVHAVAGFTNKSLRSLVAGLLGADFTPSQMTYDLRRLRLHGLIERIPHTNTYTLTPAGCERCSSTSRSTAAFWGRSCAPDSPPAPVELRLGP